MIITSIYMFTKQNAISIKPNNPLILISHQEVLFDHVYLVDLPLPKQAFKYLSEFCSNLKACLKLKSSKTQKLKAPRSKHFAWPNQNSFSEVCFSSAFWRSTKHANSFNEVCVGAIFCFFVKKYMNHQN